MTFPSKSRPRVAYVITESEIGGAQTHVRDLYAGLRNRVDGILVAGGNGPLFAQMEALGAQTIHIDELNNSLSFLHLVRTVWRVAAALRGNPPDLIHAHSAKGGAVARMVGAVLHIPVVYTVHGFGFKTAAPWKQRWAARLAECTLAPLTTQMICVSDAEAQMAETLPIRRARVHMIRNGIADTAQRSEPASAVTQVVMTARYAAPKRHDVLIQAAGDGAIPANARVTLVGDGPQRGSLERLAAAANAATTCFAGNIDNVADVLAASQLFVLFSDHEGLPISILEAMRAGLPILASDLPGIREQIVHGESGWLVDHRDATAVNAALRMLCGDAGRRQALGAAARKRYEALFGIAAMVEQTYTVYQRALQASPTRQS
ncbi:glycosyltransferase [Ralstonia sp. ASV6]|uniref:glycosyltransferase n=1 Tax=Ralstonia sp. ASV6 TaxID=2795124 RepID=UPI0018EADD43|nr:glycosyltransferase [Ralstonia sp. ASV6]